MSDALLRLRNIGIVAHIDAGKTTLTERMLFYSGLTHRVGEVDKGTTVTDYDPEEQERGITINAACVTFPWRVQTTWKDHLDVTEVQINLIDTPGHVDFTAEVERSLRVLDGAVVVFSAREGVEAQSETVWHQADRYRVPRLAFINKMDREGADYYETLEEIRTRLGCCPLALNLPFGAGPAHLDNPFRGVVDLLSMQLLTFPPEREGAQIVTAEVPDTFRPQCHEWRARLLDRLSWYSDDITAHLLAEEEVPPGLIHRVLRQATLAGQVVPVFCGSALRGIGVQPVLDAVAAYLPSPADLPPIQGFDPQRGNAPAQRRPDPAEPFCGLVFKVQADRHGDLHYVRIYSGELKAQSRVYNPGKDKKENVPQLWRIQSDRRQQLAQASTGEIVGMVGLRHSITGDTLCDPRHPILLEAILFPETVISMAVEPETSVERKKLAAALDMMRRQDPTFRTQENEETGQTLISGMGELHLEVIKHRLLRDFKLNVRFHKPRVSYRETIETAVELVGECRRQVAGQTLFARLRVRMEPDAEATQPVVLANCGASLPEPFLAAAVEVLSERSRGGGSLGFPLMHVKISILGGEFREQESTELAFRLAAADAFERGLREAGIRLLEPIMRLEVATPEENYGEIVGDLQHRRAVITRTHRRGKLTIIEAQAPLANLFGYASAMRSLTQGRATCTMEPHSYGPAPPEVLQSFL